MVNSGSFDAAGSEGESAKAEFTQLEEGDAVLRSAASPRHLTEFAAVVPNAPETGSDETHPERDDGLNRHDISESTTKTSLQCSVPLDKVKNVLDLCKNTHLTDNSKFSNYFILENYLKHKQNTPNELNETTTLETISESVEQSQSSKPIAKRLLCLFCERTFTSNNLKQKHVDRCHSTGQTRRSSSRTSSHSPSTTACCFCSKLNHTEHTLKQLLEHLINEHSNRYFACLSCQERFTNIQSLCEHNKLVHGVHDVLEQKATTTQLPSGNNEIPVILLKESSFEPKRANNNNNNNENVIKIETTTTAQKFSSPSSSVSSIKSLKRSSSLKNVPPENIKIEQEKQSPDKFSGFNIDFENSISANIISAEDVKKNRQREEEDEDSDDSKPLRKFRNSTVNLRKRTTNVTNNKKIGVKSTKNGVRTSLRTTRQTVKQMNNFNKNRRNKESKSEEETEEVAKPPEPKKPESNSTSVFSLVNAYIFKYEKIYDHSSDSIKDANSMQFNAIFDKEFYCRTVSNIRENLMNHLDGKLNRNIESESRISNFEHNPTNVPETDTKSTTDTLDNFGCNLSLNAVTPVATLLASSQYGEDFDAQIEYGAKASQKKSKKVAVVKYKFPNKKYNSLFRNNDTHNDLTCLDMWTQLTVKQRQHKSHDDDFLEIESLFYDPTNGFVAKHHVAELNRILDTRGPFEDLRLEANAAHFFELRKKSIKDGDKITEEAAREVYNVIEELLNRVIVKCNEDCDVKIENNQEENENITNVQQNLELPNYLQLEKSPNKIDKVKIDKTDAIAVICSAQENIENPENTRLELTGEWTRPRIYVCATCGLKLPNLKSLDEHKNLDHPHIWCSHYEFVGSQSQIYRHLSIPGLGKVGLVESLPQNRLWQKSDARICSKCTKQCHNLGELHKHILECGGDWTWMLARKKCKYRPYGARSRRRRQRGYKRSCNLELNRVPRENKPKPNFIGPRPKPTKPSDAETIERMLANLPPKRNRKMISMRDGIQGPRKQYKQRTNSKINGSKNLTSKNFHFKNNTSQIAKRNLRSALQRKVAINNMRKHMNENHNDIQLKLRSRINKNATENNKKDKTIENDITSHILANKNKIRNKRMISRILGSKIFDSSSALVTRRRLVKAITQNNLIRKTRLRTKMLENAQKETHSDKSEGLVDNESDKSLPKNKNSDEIVKDSRRSLRNQNTSEETKMKDENTSKKSNTKRIFSVFSKSNKKLTAESDETSKSNKKSKEELKSDTISAVIDEVLSKSSQIPNKKDTINAVIDEVLGKPIKKPKLKSTEKIKPDTISAIIDEVVNKAFKDVPDSNQENNNEFRRTRSTNKLPDFDFKIDKPDQEEILNTDDTSLDSKSDKTESKKLSKISKVLGKKTNKFMQNLKSFRKTLKNKKDDKEEGIASKLIRTLSMRNSKRKKIEKSTESIAEEKDDKTSVSSSPETEFKKTLTDNLVTKESEETEKEIVSETVQKNEPTKSSEQAEIIVNSTESISPNPSTASENVTETDKTPEMEIKNEISKPTEDSSAQSNNCNNTLSKFKNKIKRSGRGLNDCIAMLKCKLEQKTEITESSLVDKSNLFILNSTEDKITPIIENSESSSDKPTDLSLPKSEVPEKSPNIPIIDETEADDNLHEIPKFGIRKDLISTEVSTVEIETQTAEEDITSTTTAEYIPTNIQSNIELSYVLNATLKNCLMECVKNKCDELKFGNQSAALKLKSTTKDRKIGSVRKRRAKPKVSEKLIEMNIPTVPLVLNTAFSEKFSNKICVDSSKASRTTLEEASDDDIPLSKFVNHTSFGQKIKIKLSVAKKKRSVKKQIAFTPLILNSQDSCIPQINLSERIEQQISLHNSNTEKETSKKREESTINLTEQSSTKIDKKLSEKEEITIEAPPLSLQVMNMEEEPCDTILINKSLTDSELITSIKQTFQNLIKPENINKTKQITNEEKNEIIKSESPETNNDETKFESKTSSDLFSSITENKKTVLTTEPLVNKSTRKSRTRNKSNVQSEPDEESSTSQSENEQIILPLRKSRSRTNISKTETENLHQSTNEDFLTPSDLSRRRKSSTKNKTKSNVISNIKNDKVSQPKYLETDFDFDDDTPLTVLIKKSGKNNCEENIVNSKTENELISNSEQENKTKEVEFTDSVDGNKNISSVELLEPLQNVETDKITKSNEETTIKRKRNSRTNKENILKIENKSTTESIENITTNQLEIAISDISVEKNIKRRSRSKKHTHLDTLSADNLTENVDNIQNQISIEPSTESSITNEISTPEITRKRERSRKSKTIDASKNNILKESVIQSESVENNSIVEPDENNVEESSKRKRMNLVEVPNNELENKSFSLVDENIPEKENNQNQFANEKSLTTAEVSNFNESANSSEAAKKDKRKRLICKSLKEDLIKENDSQNLDNTDNATDCIDVFLLQKENGQNLSLQSEDNIEKSSENLPSANSTNVFNSETFQKQEISFSTETSTINKTEDSTKPKRGRKKKLSIQNISNSEPKESSEDILENIRTSSSKENELITELSTPSDNSVNNQTVPQQTENFVPKRRGRKKKINSCQENKNPVLLDSGEKSNESHIVEEALRTEDLIDAVKRRNKRVSTKSDSYNTESENSTLEKSDLENVTEVTMEEVTKRGRKKRSIKNDNISINKNSETVNKSDVSDSMVNDDSNKSDSADSKTLPEPEESVRNQNFPEIPEKLVGSKRGRKKRTIHNDSISKIEDKPTLADSTINAQNVETEFSLTKPESLPEEIVLNKRGRRRKSIKNDSLLEIEATQKSAEPEKILNEDSENATSGRQKRSCIKNDSYAETDLIISSEDSEKSQQAIITEKSKRGRKKRLTIDSIFTSIENDIPNSFDDLVKSDDINSETKFSYEDAVATKNEESKGLFTKDDLITTIEEPNQTNNGSEIQKSDNLNIEDTLTENSINTKRGRKKKSAKDTLPINSIVENNISTTFEESEKLKATETSEISSKVKKGRKKKYVKDESSLDKPGINIDTAENELFKDINSETVISTEDSEKIKRGKRKKSIQVETENVNTEEILTTSLNEPVELDILQNITEVVMNEDAVNLPKERKRRSCTKSDSYAEPEITFDLSETVQLDNLEKINESVVNKFELDPEISPEESDQLNHCENTEVIEEPNLKPEIVPPNNEIYQPQNSESISNAVISPVRGRKKRSSRSDLFSESKPEFTSSFSEFKQLENSLDSANEDISYTITGRRKRSCVKNDSYLDSDSTSSFSKASSFIESENSFQDDLTRGRKKRSIKNESSAKLTSTEDKIEENKISFSNDEVVESTNQFQNSTFSEINNPVLTSRRGRKKKSTQEMTTTINDTELFDNLQFQQKLITNEMNSVNEEPPAVLTPTNKRGRKKKVSHVDINKTILDSEFISNNSKSEDVETDIVPQIIQNMDDSLVEDLIENEKFLLNLENEKKNRKYSTDTLQIRAGFLEIISGQNEKSVSPLTIQDSKNKSKLQENTNESPETSELNLENIQTEDLNTTSFIPSKEAQFKNDDLISELFKTTEPIIETGTVEESTTYVENQKKKKRGRKPKISNQNILEESIENLNPEYFENEETQNKRRTRAKSKINYAEIDNETSNEDLLNKEETLQISSVIIEEIPTDIERKKHRSRSKNKHEHSSTDLQSTTSQISDLQSSLAKLEKELLSNIENEGRKRRKSKSKHKNNESHFENLESTEETVRNEEPTGNINKKSVPLEQTSLELIKDDKKRKRSNTLLSSSSDLEFEQEYEDEIEFRKKNKETPLEIIEPITDLLTNVQEENLKHKLDADQLIKNFKIQLHTENEPDNNIMENKNIQEISELDLLVNSVLPSTHVSDSEDEVPLASLLKTKKTDDNEIDKDVSKLTNDVNESSVMSVNSLLNDIDVPLNKDKFDLVECPPFDFEDDNIINQEELSQFVNITNQNLLENIEKENELIPAIIQETPEKIDILDINKLTESVENNDDLPITEIDHLSKTEDASKTPNQVDKSDLFKFLKTPPEKQITTSEFITTPDLADKSLIVKIKSSSLKLKLRKPKKGRRRINSKTVSKSFSKKKEDDEIFSCEICNKIFCRKESLSGHKKTLTHIAKLSEIEARENMAQKLLESNVKVKSNDEKLELQKPIIDNFEEIAEPDEDMEPEELLDPVKDFDMEPQKSIPNLLPGLIVNSTNSTLKLIDIINEVLDEPRTEIKTKENMFSPQNILKSPSSCDSSETYSEPKRYKSLGERKSFDSDSYNLPSKCNDDISNSDNYKQISNGEILCKQLSILENIIEETNPGLNNYMDDSVSLSSSQFDEPITEDPNVAEKEIFQSSKYSKLDHTQLKFSHTADVLSSLIKPSNHFNNFENISGNFTKPTKYREIKEENKRKTKETTRKILNRDEELFVECCSLLKSGSEISGASKKSKQVSLHSFSRSNDANWNIQKQNSNQMIQRDSYSWLAQTSRVETPIGEPLVSNDWSNSNSAVSSEWLAQKGHSPDRPTENSTLNKKSNNNSGEAKYSHLHFEDISIDNSLETSKTLMATDNTNNENIPLDFHHVVFSSNNLNERSERNPITINEENDEEDYLSSKEEFHHLKTKNTFGGIMTKTITEHLQISPRKKKIKGKRDFANTIQSSIVDYTIPTKKSKSSHTDSDSSDCPKKLITKGAMKIFEGLKVSIPTQDLNLTEVLNSTKTKKTEHEDATIPSQVKDEVLTENAKIECVVEKLGETSDRNGKLKSLLNQFGNKLGLREKKKKNNKRRSPKSKNQSTKSTHDVYEFEESLDSNLLPNTNSFSLFKNTREDGPEKTVPNDAENVEKEDVNNWNTDSESDTDRYYDSMSFEEASLSSESTHESNIVNKPKTIQKRSEKKEIQKKCMIMGRIFKNASKPKLEDKIPEIRDLSSEENSKLVENYLDSCSSAENIANDNAVITEVLLVPNINPVANKMSKIEIDLLFDKLKEGEEKSETSNVEIPSINKETQNDDVFNKPLLVKRKPKLSSKNKKRQRHNSDSASSDEFRLGAKHSKSTKKHHKSHRKPPKTKKDTGINLEQEMKECIGVAGRKSQRKCTSGKQNVLVEFWSSDESSFEEILNLLEKQNESKIQKIPENLEETPTITQSDNLLSNNNLNSPQISEEQITPEKEEKKKHTLDIYDFESDVDSQIGEYHTKSAKPFDSPEPGMNKLKLPRKVPKQQKGNKKQNKPLNEEEEEDIEYEAERNRRRNEHKRKKISENEETTTTGEMSAESLAATRKKRNAGEQLYYWSSSSDDEFQDLIEVKPIREDTEDDRPMQHGWIVGDSPKKLVTMLAQAKGKKIDSESVKEQSKKNRVTL